MSRNPKDHSEFELGRLRTNINLFALSSLILNVKDFRTEIDEIDDKSVFKFPLNINYLVRIVLESF